MRAAFAVLILAALAAGAVNGQVNQCHYDCYNYKGSVSDAEMLKSQAVAACKAQNVAGTPVFSPGPGYFQAHANTAPEAGCTLSVCTPFTDGGYGTAYTNCEHATTYYKTLTDPSNLSSNAARANSNAPCTACPATS